MTHFPALHYAATAERSAKTGLPLYRLIDPLQYIDRELGRIDILPGFRTDFVSAPNFRRLFGKAGRASALLHDYGYSVMVPEHRATRVQVDAMFARALKIEGVAWWLRALMVAAVQCNTAKRRVLT